jgi:hypothetical protein
MLNLPSVVVSLCVIFCHSANALMHRPRSGSQPFAACASSDETKVATLLKPVQIKPMKMIHVLIDAVGDLAPG